MKYFLLLILFVISSTTLYAQHTERYIKLTKDLKPVDSAKATFKYKDRKQIIYIVEKYIYNINVEKVICDFGERTNVC